MGETLVRTTLVDALLGLCGCLAGRPHHAMGPAGNAMGRGKGHTAQSTLVTNAYTELVANTDIVASFFTDNADMVINTDKVADTELAANADMTNPDLGAAIESADTDLVTSTNLDSDTELIANTDMVVNNFIGADTELVVNTDSVANAIMTNPDLGAAIESANTDLTTSTDLPADTELVANTDMIANNLMGAVNTKIIANVNAEMATFAPNPELVAAIKAVADTIMAMRQASVGAPD